MNVNAEDLDTLTVYWQRETTYANEKVDRKALAAFQPDVAPPVADATIAAAMEDPSLSFAFPSPPELRPPLVTLDMPV